MERVLNGKPRRAGMPLEPPVDGGDSPAWSRKRGAYLPPDDVRRGESDVPYAELHAHSAYSFLDGASTPEELVEEAVRLDLRAIALTDHDGLYGVVRFAEAAKELEHAHGVRRGAVAWRQRPHRGPRSARAAPAGAWPAGRKATGGCRVSWPSRTWPAAKRASRATTSTR